MLGMFATSFGGHPLTFEYFADFRDADVVKAALPLWRAVAIAILEETTFDRFRLNTKID